jgi:CheY-like chemotaxis protein
MVIHTHSVSAQNLSAEQQANIQQLEEQVENALANAQYATAASANGKIAYIYWESGMTEKAIETFQQTISYNEKIGNKNGIKTIHYNIGLIYTDMQKYATALAEFNKGIELAREMKQKQGILNGLLNKASALESMEKHQEAIDATLEALEMAKELKNMKLIRSCYGTLSQNYKAIGNSEKSMEYFEQYSTLDKHIKNEQVSQIKTESQQQVEQIKTEKEEKEKALAKTEQELKVKSDSLVETKELTEKQKMEIELQEAQIKNDRMIKYGLIGIIVLTLIFLVIFFIQIRQKKKKNKLLQEQNHQINEQKQEIEKQRDIATKQKKNITDSIEYASRIQNALLPPDYLIDKIIPEHFIFFKPRDIVSGDFYWMTPKDNKLILVAADCTGHGVPGAFMSMLGTAFLNEIVNKITENKHIYSLQANEILNQLRNYIIESLHQNKDNSDSKDGIDMALVIIDFDTQKIQFAGAHNPLYIIRKGELLETKGDRMPVAIHKKADQPFTNHEVEFKDQDTIYLFSDGFPDQIGGDKGRKYMSRHFKSLLMDIHTKPMAEQKSILENKFDEWRNGYEQMDDILIIGAKLQTKELPKTKTKKDYNWEKNTILIAEDTEINYIFLSEALKSTDVKILHAHDGEKAYQMIKDNPQIDLVLMDINMPKMDGFEATQKIREIKPDIPIIAQTALSIENAKEKAKEVGCDDFILKPIKLKSFLSLLDSYLTKTKK